MAFLFVGPMNDQARCLRVDPLTIFAARAVSVSSGAAVATIEAPLPGDLALVGTILVVQWVLERVRGFECSAALELELGIGPRHPTTCAGSVVLVDGTPVVDAEVEIVGLGLRATTDAAGRFTVPEVAIQNTGVHVVATASVAGRRMSGHLEPIEPRPVESAVPPGTKPI